MKSGTNVIRFPLELRRCDLDTLERIEPDVMLADRLSEKFDLDILPFDSIECGEIEARNRIAMLDRSDPVVLHQTIRRMNEQAIGLAISLCRQAGEADLKASQLRQRAEALALLNPGAHNFYDRVASTAERTAAVLTLSAIAASHRARGIDAVVLQVLNDLDTAACFGTVGPVAMVSSNTG